MFLYFACLAPIVAFGGLLGEATENRIATIESLVAGTFPSIFAVGIVKLNVHLKTHRSHKWGHFWYDFWSTVDHIGIHRTTVCF